MKKVILEYLLFLQPVYYISYIPFGLTQSPKEIDVYKFQELNIEVNYSRPSKGAIDCKEDQNLCLHMVNTGGWC